MLEYCLRPGKCFIVFLVLQERERARLASLGHVFPVRRPPHLRSKVSVLNLMFIHVEHVCYCLIFRNL